MTAEREVKYDKFGGPHWMYVELKTGLSTFLKLTYIQESLKMHGKHVERQCSTRIVFGACSEIRSHGDFTPIFSAFSLDDFIGKNV